MTSSRPVLGCVRSTTGLGFIHTCLMGIYIGTPTYIISPVDFAQNPISLFLTLSRYKIKDTYATPQMLDHAMAMMQAKGFTLHELKNLMITADTRPRVDVFQKVRLHFAATGLDRTSINTVYSHILNPMITSRSYMCIEPIELWLDTKALRRGLVLPRDPDPEGKGLLMVQDSGMVPVSTQIAIVNPESCILCHDGEYGEIWVDSEACVKAFYGSKDSFDRERFNGRTVDGDPNIPYVRTGDLGFLHSVSRPIGPGGALVDMQVLFVLGSIGETFEINGLSHFPMDIEATVERSHRMITPNGCAVFQAGGLCVVLVEVARKAYLAALVPVIVNAILNEHQIVVDIVAFVNRGDFPRSRLGEKQRGKILAGWVTRKLRTMCQFSIRDMSSILDPHSMDNMAPDVQHRTSIGSIRSAGGPGSSSLRNVEPAPQILEQRELEHQMDQDPVGQIQGGGHPQAGYISHYEPPRIPQSQYSASHGFDLPDFDRFGTDDTALPHQQYQLQQPSQQARPQASPYGSAAPAPLSPTRSSGTPQIQLPSVDGRETNWQGQGSNLDDEADWTADAIMHMNLAGGTQSLR